MTLNIVESFLEVKCANGEPHRVAVDAINARLGTKHTVSRLYAWRNGGRAIPREVQDIMLEAVIASAIEREGGTLPANPRVRQSLVQRLTPPPAAR